MSDPRLESLLAPLSAESPCGEDPEYDADFIALMEASVGKPEKQVGTTVVAAKPPDWPSVYTSALALAARTRDLRVAVMLARGAARIEGLPGLALGLALLDGLLARYWVEVHPRLDPGEVGGDPTTRLTALGALSHPAAGLADFRAATLTGQRGGLPVRDLELAVGHAEPLPGETVPTEEGALAGLRDAFAARPGLAGVMLEVAGAAPALVAAFEQRLDVQRTPKLEALQRLLGHLVTAARRVGEAEAAEAIPAAQADAPAASAPAAAPGTLRSREDVIRALERACEWIERNEPTNPAPLLIRRSQRLMTKTFVDIIRDLVPGGVGEIEKLAGPGGS